MKYVVLTDLATAETGVGVPEIIHTIEKEDADGLLCPGFDSDDVQSMVGAYHASRYLEASGYDVELSIGGHDHSYLRGYVELDDLPNHQDEYGDRLSDHPEAETFYERLSETPHNRFNLGNLRVEMLHGARTEIPHPELKKGESSLLDTKLPEEYKEDFDVGFLTNRFDWDGDFSRTFDHMESEGIDLFLSAVGDRADIAAKNDEGIHIHSTEHPTYEAAEELFLGSYYPLLEDNHTIVNLPEFGEGRYAVVEITPPSNRIVFRQTDFPEMNRSQEVAV